MLTVRRRPCEGRDRVGSGAFICSHLAHDLPDKSQG